MTQPEVHLVLIRLGGRWAPSRGEDDAIAAVSQVMTGLVPPREVEGSLLALLAAGVR